MHDVFLIAIGQVPVTRDASTGVRDLGATAVRQALASVDPGAVSALFVGNMMSGILSDQQQLGAHIAHASGLPGVEALTVEAACGSGAAAARVGALAVAAGVHRAVAVVGVERMTHAPRDAATHALATASDWECEGGRGETFVSLNARLMRAYMEQWKVGPDAFAPFSMQAHRNAMTNPNALFHREVGLSEYLASREIVAPVRLYDASPMCDGAAAVILADRETARALLPPEAPRIRIRASAIGTDTLALADRRDLLALDGVARSTSRALDAAGLHIADIDIFELHDAYTVISVLSIEAAGFAAPGHGWEVARDEGIALNGRLPISTFGGLKARGHPVGATGVYQLCETWLQLAGRAGVNQVPGARTAMTQNVGGTGATVVTHVLERVD